MSKLIDLTHSLENGQPVYSGDPKLAITPHDNIAVSGYNTTRLSMSSHQGTHLDAPSHFFDGAKTLNQISLDRFHGPASLIDLAPGGALEPQTRITPESLHPHAELFRPGSRILYRTGWDKMYGRLEFFSNYPSLTVEAAQWIASRRVSLLGMDTPSPSEDWQQVHSILLGPQAEIVIVESLANLEMLPPNFTFIGFPLNVKGIDGSPIRAVACL